ncbi:hypothetical protein [Prevotella ihumii]|uniref:hypothetical protein n=1 Tax=Prevotella ihumii TaxID=1917878 RepID=UPI000981C45F|nr:hypothetical protein [Prevotella ihumii]
MKKFLLIALSVVLAIGASAQDVIKTVPAGVHKFYKRIGKTINQGTGQPEDIRYTTMEVVTTVSNEVYFKDPIAAAHTGTWVLGKKEGNVITVKTGQPVLFIPSMGQGVSTTLKLDVYEMVGTEYKKSADTEFTYEIQGDNIVMSSIGKDGKKIIGFTLVYDSGEAWASNGEFGVELTPLAEKLTEMPAGVTAKNYVLSASTPDPESETGVIKYEGDIVKVARTGDDVYFKGIFKYCPDGVIKGKMDANKNITFAKDQYLGMLPAMIYLEGCSKIMEFIDDMGNMADVVFVYNEAADTYTLKEGTTLVFNHGPEYPNPIGFYTYCMLSGNTAGINGVMNNANEAMEVSYFDLTGKRISKPTSGIVIKKVKMANGSFKVSKVVMQ